MYDLIMRNNKARNVLYVVGALGGLGLLAGGVHVLRDKPIDEPAAVQQSRKPGEVIDNMLELWRGYSLGPYGQWFEKNEEPVIEVIDEDEDGMPERIQYLDDKFEESLFDLWGIHRTSAADAWELTKDYGHGTHVSPSISEKSDPTSFMDILMEIYEVDSPAEAMHLWAEETWERWTLGLKK